MITLLLLTSLLFTFTPPQGSRVIRKGDRAKVEQAAKRVWLDNMLYPQIGGLAWYDENGDLRTHLSPLLFTPLGACDSTAECEEETDEMCEEAGQEGVDPETVEITTHENDDGKTCSGDCIGGNGVAFVICNSPS